MTNNNSQIKLDGPLFIQKARQLPTEMICGLRLRKTQYSFMTAFSNQKAFMYS